MLRLAGREWPLSGKFPGGLAMKISRAESNKDWRAAMTLTLRMASLLVAEEQRADFEAFVDSDDFDDLGYEEISEAVAAAIADATDRPTKKSAPSATGQTATRAISKVGSSSPDVVEMMPPPERYTFGRSAAS